MPTCDYNSFCTWFESWIQCLLWFIACFNNGIMKIPSGLHPIFALSLQEYLFHGLICCLLLSTFIQVKNTLLFYGISKPILCIFGKPSACGIWKSMYALAQIASRSAFFDFKWILIKFLQNIFSSKVCLLKVIQSWKKNICFAAIIER